jgi:hypothetical protein
MEKKNKKYVKPKKRGKKKKNMGKKKKDKIKKIEQKKTNKKNYKAKLTKIILENKSCRETL